MKKMSIRQFINATILCLVVVLSISCSYFDDGNKQGGKSSSGDSVTPAVEAVKARFGSLPLSERLSGTVVANNQVSLYPEISGKIKAVHVQNGDKVAKGDPIVSLEDQQYQESLNQAKANQRINNARLKQAKARYSELQAKYVRTKKLSDKKLSSELEIEQLEAQRTSARADIDLAKAQLQQSESNVSEQQNMLSKTIIRAPISGSVGGRNAESGMQVSSSTQLFTIGDLDNLRVEVVLTDHMLNDIKVGQSVNIYPDPENKNGKVLDAKLSRISPFLNDVTRSTQAEIDIKNKDNVLRPGMFVAVDVLYGKSRQAVLIPTSALYTNPQTGKTGVYVASAVGSEIKPIKQVDPDNPPPLTEATDITFKQIDVIAEGRMRVGINGIDPGSWIVTVGQNLLDQEDVKARVRTSTWERILTMQGLQRQSLLQKVMNEGNADTSS